MFSFYSFPCHVLCLLAANYSLPAWHVMDGTSLLPISAVGKSYFCKKHQPLKSFFPPLCFYLLFQIHEKLCHFERQSPVPVLHSASALAEDVSVAFFGNMSVRSVFSFWLHYKSCKGLSMYDHQAIFVSECVLMIL